LGFRLHQLRVSSWALRCVLFPGAQGDNAYQCETCNEKTEALKGYKFAKLPYVLTLQIKRFDFDYSYMRRIKLNDEYAARRARTDPPFEDPFLFLLLVLDGRCGT
jgi:hypothetical protein